jgi:hypothetical protein
MMFDSGRFIGSWDGNTVVGAIRIDGDSIEAIRDQRWELVPRAELPSPEDTLRLETDSL